MVLYWNFSDLAPPVHFSIPFARRMPGRSLLALIIGQLSQAKEGELEYFKQLDDREITSDVIHDWINQHQSYFTELGTIRRYGTLREIGRAPRVIYTKSPKVAVTKSISIQDKVQYAYCVTIQQIDTFRTC